MNKSTQERIHKNRRLLGNPYAYLNDEGNFDAYEPNKEMTGNHQIVGSRKLLQDPYAHLNDKGKFDAVLPRSKGEFRLSAQALNNLNSGGKKKRYSYSEIESIANKLLREMWTNRDQLLGTSSDPMRLLAPSVGIKSIGYDFQLEESLGQFQKNGKHIEVAGIIDNDDKAIHISRQFPLTVRNYTAAHELGHALLHEATGLHRDRALDGTTSVGQRAPIEMEADKFASFFLMPAKQVRTKFKQLFLTDKFSINENTLFALDSHTATKIRKNRNNLRLISRTISELEHYNGRHFTSLAQLFGVSVEALAIRLEELELIEI